jgi:putative flippase GtrA
MTTMPVDAAREVDVVTPGAGPKQAFREIRAFAVIGVLSTLAYLLLYTALRSVSPAPAANAVALIVTAIGNTAANRRLTFGVRGRESMGRHHLAGLVAFGVALFITSVAIAALQLAVPRPGRLLEVAVLVAANGAATIARFLLLRTWIGRPSATQAAPSDPLPFVPSLDQGASDD